MAANDGTRPWTAAEIKGTPAPKITPAPSNKPTAKDKKAMAEAEANDRRLVNTLNMKRGGKVMKSKGWEGSAKDEAQDKKLAKKHGMSMPNWEKSAMDKKHDKQKSTAGLARGGGVETKGKTRGATVKMCSGGGVEMKGKTRGRIV